MLKKPQITTFYHPKMSMDIRKLSGTSKTPAKAKLLMEYLRNKKLEKHLKQYPGFHCCKGKIFTSPIPGKWSMDFLMKGKPVAC